MSILRLESGEFKRRSSIIKNQVRRAREILQGQIEQANAKATPKMLAFPDRRGDRRINRIQDSFRDDRAFHLFVCFDRLAATSCDENPLRI